MARDYEVLGSNPATAKLYSAEPDNGGWHYCSRMLACCVFHYSTYFFVKQNNFSGPILNPSNNIREKVETEIERQNSPNFGGMCL